ncbi:DUF397 domain-containing protein [Streptomyces stramineus]|uniref:DUF397 domain-containing protein n=1 Tax=Streptomyces TaxID=1883 RepID=UPI0031D02CB3
MRRRGLPVSAWRKSSYSGETGPQCVEIQPTSDDLIAIGDSKDRPRGALAVPPATWSTFIRALQRNTLHPS